MKLFFLTLLFAIPALSLQATPDSLRGCKESSDCAIVKESTCEIAEAVSIDKQDEWHKIAKANSLENYKLFPKGKQCKPALPWAIAECKDSLCVVRYEDQWAVDKDFVILGMLEKTNYSEGERVWFFIPLFSSGVSHPSNGKISHEDDHMSAKVASQNFYEFFDGKVRGSLKAGERMAGYSVMRFHPVTGNKISDSSYAWYKKERFVFATNRKSTEDPDQWKISDIPADIARLAKLEFLKKYPVKKKSNSDGESLVLVDTKNPLLEKDVKIQKRSFKSKNTEYLVGVKAPVSDNKMGEWQAVDQIHWVSINKDQVPKLVSECIDNGCEPTEAGDFFGLGSSQWIFFDELEHRGSRFHLFSGQFELLSKRSFLKHEGPR